MEKIIIVAHGISRKGYGHPNVKVITKSEQPLTFEDAKSYMKGTFYPEYSSASMSEFAPLSDKECRELFGIIPQGSGIINTGKCRGGIHGEQIFVLRNCNNKSLPEIGIFAANKNFSVVMLACRSYS